MRITRPAWLNISVLGGVHALALVALVYLVLADWSWWSVALAALWLGLSGLAITGGYHRLFAHGTYRARAALRLFYVIFGAAAVQNSALKWAADHRQHHSNTDRARDPYSIRQGFWWAHIGWVLNKRTHPPRLDLVGDLAADPIVAWQHKYYVPLAICMSLVAPALLGTLWGDPVGAVLIAGVLRLTLQWHSTFSINSIAHLIGNRPYCTRSSARDSVWTALASLGEGYHNFHHRFQTDYRNGIRWYHFDPTKWFVWLLSHVRITSDLRRAPRDAIQRALADVRAGRA